MKVLLSLGLLDYIGTLLNFILLITAAFSNGDLPPIHGYDKHLVGPMGVSCNGFDDAITSDDFSACGGKCTVLHQAVLYGCDLVVWGLVTVFGYSIINEKDEDGMTALHLAAMQGNVALVDMLLEAGSELQAMDDESNTALHYAAHNGHWKVCEALILHGIDMSARNTDRHTALHMAVLAGNFDTCRILIDYGTKLMRIRRDVDGHTAEDLAISSGNIALMKLFQYKADIIVAPNIPQTLPLPTSDFSIRKQIRLLKKRLGT